ncbi:MAG: hypothetical protein CMM01_13325 [Rhodopirellula sp.]|nr:hypothetical protein [Rhodopirellula sp.]OUX50751.1 MAG: hypothetical protein CBE43_05785 [Rhodopirellula sp. TMED283]
MPRFPLLFAVLSFPLIVGCDGCRTESTVNPDVDSELNAEDFVAGRPMPYPTDEKITTSGIKPGHWFTAVQSLKSNNSDSRGDLNSLSGMVEGPSLQSGKQASWSDTQALRRGSMISRRPVVMPRGQNKEIDYRTYTPKRFFEGKAKCYLSNRFVSSERAESFSTGAYPFTRMAAAEYFFVVLTQRPERFTRFQVSDWTRAIRDETSFDMGEPVINYRVVAPSPEDYYPLPLPLAETMLDWTNTAVVFWDDLPPEALTPRQQTALADWVHYGGQLIVNGAAAADSINKSGLADLLPLRPTGNIELDVDAATELLLNWQVPEDSSTDQQVALLKGRESRVAIDGVAIAGTDVIDGSGNLIVSRRAGSGRVVQSRCDLLSDWLTSWKSYDSFVNSVLLLRPARRCDPVQKVDGSGRMNLRTYVLPNGSEKVFADPTMNTRFRIAARDAVLPIVAEVVKRPSTAFLSGQDAYTQVDTLSGIGGWSDSSDVMRLCRETLRSKAGIEIPDSSLVFRSLGYYLCLLIPVNYLIFRMLGKLEYAWLAVPVIAIGGAIWVAREARLDIGFARSQTELGLLETQAGCDRAHLTRVTAIYNSLSSTYDIAFDTPGAAALPIRQGTDAAPISAVFKTGYAEGPILSGMIVGSNQIRMVHAEQMFSLGGALSLEANGNLVNGTDRELFDAVVIRKDPLGEMEIANVGPCPGQSSTKLRFRPATDEEIGESLSEEMNLLERALVRGDAIAPGSARLVARVGGSLPGMTITPSATQVSSTTTVLAHLDYSPWPSPVPDVNLPKADIRVLKDSDLKTP